MAQPERSVEQALRDTQGQWETTQASWRDSGAQEFASRYWNEIENEMRQLSQALASINEAINNSSC